MQKRQRQDYAYTNLSIREFKFMLPASRPNFAEGARTVENVEQVWPQ